ncbi:MAG: DUF3108 domain-containing protein [Nitrospinota bacterium]|nr:DUF3108 domain-containing protein [Nitrospinota bacterium]
MPQSKARYSKYLIILALGSSLLLLSAFYPNFSEIPGPFKASALINSQGEYPSFTPKGDIRRFAGETLTYDIDFLFFEKAATAKVRFYEHQGKYFATLTAETKGVVGFFTNYRKHFYKSSFDIVDEGRRVQTTKFERDVIIGQQKERTIHFIDYNSRTHLWFLFSGGDLKDRSSDPIPEEVIYDDILAFFYNFRNGVYGDLKKGGVYKIDTVPENSMKSITTHISTEEEQEEFRINENRAKKDELLLKVTIPKDVFKTETGELIFWASNHYIPLETTIKDYLLLGDLHGKLTSGIPGKLK